MFRRTSYMVQSSIGPLEDSGSMAIEQGAEPIK
jgi:hypothetical protein